MSQQSGRYGVTFIDLATGESFGVQDKEEYIAASSTKLPMVLLLYIRMRREKWTLTCSLSTNLNILNTGRA